MITWMIINGNIFFVKFLGARSVTIFEEMYTKILMGFGETS